MAASEGLGIVEGQEDFVLNPFTVRKIMKKGRPAQARVISMTTPARGASKFNLGMTLEVHLPGQPPYEVEDQWIVSADTPLGFGMMLPVRVHPSDNDKLAIDWDAHRAEQHRVKEQRRQALSQQPPVGSGQSGTQDPFAGQVDAQVIDTRNNPELRAQVLKSFGIDDPGPASSSASDPTLAALEKLAALRDAGVLTTEEFEAQKRRILDNS